MHKAPRLVLQEKDRELLRLLAEEFMLLTRSQIGELFPGRSVQRSNFRLRRLLLNKYLSRRTSPLLPTGTALYYLGPLAGEALGLEPEDAAISGRRKRALRIADGALPHLVLVNSVHAKFVVAQREYPSEYQVLTHIPQYAPVWNTLNQYGFPLRPDGYVAYRYDAATFCNFLEVDLGTERGETIRKKFEAYQEYAASSQFERHFSASRFRVLFITVGKRRAQQLLRHAQGCSPDLIWVTTAEQLLSRPLFEPHWSVSGASGPQSLQLPV